MFKSLWHRFKDLLREVGQDFANDLRFSKEGMALLQYSIEEYIIDLFSDANLNTIHAGRKSVKPKDIQLARRVRGEK